MFIFIYCDGKLFKTEDILSAYVDRDGITLKFLVYNYEDISKIKHHLGICHKIKVLTNSHTENNLNAVNTFMFGEKDTIPKKEIGYIYNENKNILFAKINFIR